MSNITGTCQCHCRLKDGWHLHKPRHTHKELHPEARGKGPILDIVSLWCSTFAQLMSILCPKYAVILYLTSYHVSAPAIKTMNIIKPCSKIYDFSSMPSLYCCMSLVYPSSKRTIITPLRAMTFRKQTGKGLIEVYSWGPRSSGPSADPPSGSRT